MIEFLAEGDLFDTDVDAIVNTVNTTGVMGGGIALQFRQTFPEYFDVYKAACEKDEIRVGHVHVYGGSEYDPWIISFPTKDHVRDPSQMHYVIDGLHSLRRLLISGHLMIDSIALPALGCGLGGLDWFDVKPQIEMALGDLPQRILVFEPQ